jgi:hypothetical protein
MLGEKGIVGRLGRAYQKKIRRPQILFVRDFGNPDLVTSKRRKIFFPHFHFPRREWKTCHCESQIHRFAFAGYNEREPMNQNGAIISIF